MADEFGKRCDWSSCHEVVGDESVAKVIDFGAINPPDPKVAVDCRPDIADEQGFAGFGNKQGRIRRVVAAKLQVAAEGFFGGFVKRHNPFRMAFLGGDAELVFFNIFKGKGRKLANPYAGLEE